MKNNFTKGITIFLFSFFSITGILATPIQYSNASLKGEYFCHQDTECINFNGNGVITDIGGFVGFISGSYNVSSNGNLSVTLIYWNNGSNLDTMAITGQVTSDSTFSSIGYTFYKVKNAAVLAGNYSGTINTDNCNKAISITIDSTGAITSGSGLTASITGGFIYSDSSLVCGDILTSDTALSRITIYTGTNITDSIKGGWDISSITGNHNDSDLFGSGCDDGGRTIVLVKTSTLPLQILSFTAQKQNSNVILQWQTANEVNTNYFNIQRSSNGKDFTTIGNVGATDVSGVNNYTYTDLLTSNVSPLTNLYYRLQEIDKDGSSTYSNIATVSFTNQPSITISPNPAKGTVYVTGNSIKYITIADNSGKTIISQAVNNQTHVAVNISNLAAGIYIVKVTDAQGNVQTEELMVQ